MAIFLAPFAVLTLFFLIEVLAGLLTLPSTRFEAKPASAVVVVPAHDEAEVIGETLRVLKGSLSPGMRVLVVADNCTDRTAEAARAMGVDVLERNDAERRGKGFALAFAADYLRSDPPEIFVVMDADCAIDQASLHALVACAHALGGPAQVVNLLRPDRSAPPLVQLSNFAFVLKNLIRQRGLQRLAGRVHLTGTGMAMPFGLFHISGDTRSSIVEDLALGLDLADAGHPPKLVGNAFVWSGSASEQGTLVQRRRWEGGFLATALRQGPKEAWHGLVRGKPRAILAALDLMVPPLALFAVLNVVALLVSAALVLASRAAWWPVIAQFVLLVLALVAVLVAWAREGRDFISLGVLARLPLYVLWKVPMYLGLARRGTPKEWLRTGR
ncbi:MAG TPA: glycosyltransferase family 2 protein [Sphingomicrobium sp.]|nr:glycosyltransferase family 2 protein [Sphingomicrobium sp.]